MRLFLASRARNSIADIEKITGSLKNNSIAYIPTAANGESWEDWKRKDGTWDYLRSMHLDLSTVILEKYKDEAILKEIEGKDIVWFAGGAVGYLMYWVRRVELDKSLPKILEKTLYVGSSAGSMITAPSLEICDWYIGEHEPGASFIPGLGLVDFEIYPHYEDSFKNEIKKNFKGSKLYLLKDGEAVFVEDNKIQIIGEERVITG